MKTNTLSTTINLLLLLLIAGSTNSCKKEKETPIEGRYKVEVKVTKRLPMVGYLSSSDTIDFPHMIIHGHIFYESSSNVCCAGMYNSVDCPMEYNLEGVEIIKREGKYYLESREAYSTMGVKLRYHLPLTISDNTISYDLARDTSFPDGLLYEFDVDNRLPSGKMWPIAIKKWLSLELKKKGGNIFVGSWRNLPHMHYCTIQLPNGETRGYSMSEFADVTFTKVED